MKYSFLSLFTLLLIAVSCTESSDSKAVQSEAAQEELSQPKEVKMAKFESSHQFLDYPADEVVVKIPARLNYDSHERGTEFKTVITDAYVKRESVFAGHYIVAYWGCGSPCQTGVIVDQTDGKIYALPTAALGYRYEKQSRMLIVNPPDEDGMYVEECAYCKPEVWVWDDAEKQFINFE